MKKIAIEIKEDTLFFKYRTNKPVPVDLLNTNVISNNELVFSDDYIVKNAKIVSLFINDLAIDRNIKNIAISNNEMALDIINLLKGIKEVSCLDLKEDTTLSYSLYEKIIGLSNIKKINCYAIPTYLIELLDKAGIIVESRSEVLFTSSFMQENNLFSFSKIYYKSSVRISNDLSNDDIEDFETFIKINKYLRTIHLEKCNIKDIETICEILANERRKNINIQIHDNINDLDVIEKLRNLNKKYRKKRKIKLSLIYSKDYLEQNYLKQIIFTTLKVCSLIIFAIVGSIFGYIFYNNYQSEKKVDNIKEQITEVLGQVPEEQPVEDNQTPVEEPVQETVKADPLIENYQKLLELNSDTVGWLTVKGTKIDYPVVKSTDNSYYLKRNFNREKDYNGWVFMDYRNDAKNLDSNTIIYAHNRYYSGVMFGTLNNVTKNNWHKNPDNLYITFNSMYETMTWKVFSIYNIEVTSDYLYTNFNTSEEYQNFINLLKGRSLFEFDTEVTAQDKILTLSTCLDNNRRLVVHAVLQKEEPAQEVEEPQNTVEQNNSEQSSEEQNNEQQNSEVPNNEQQNNEELNNEQENSQNENN